MMRGKGKMMDDDFTLSIRAAMACAGLSGIPRTSAGRLQLVAELLHPIEPDTGEELEPLISKEDAIKLLETED